MRFFLVGVTATFAIVYLNTHYMQQVKEFHFPIIYLEKTQNGRNFEIVKKMFGPEISSSLSSKSFEEAINYVMDLIDLNYSKDRLNLRIRIQYENYSCYLQENLHQVKALAKFETECFRYKSLTLRQRELLELLYKQQSRKQILKIMEITESTFNSHRKEIYKKMEFKSIRDMIFWCEKYYMTCSQYQMRGYFQEIELCS